MSKDEVINEILKTPKPYNYVGLKQAAFSSAIRSIRLGTYKQSSEIEFFAKFGFDVKQETVYFKSVEVLSKNFQKSV